MNNFEQKLNNKHEDADCEQYVNQQIKLYVSMKYLFIIGEQSDFDSSSFRAFLQHIIELEGGKPF